MIRKELCFLEKFILALKGIASGIFWLIIIAILLFCLFAAVHYLLKTASSLGIT